jgi:DNA (cytosine-5)-methyltransferase 1
MTSQLTAVELCAGGGGQALGLERAGFTPVLLAEIDPDCCETLRRNRPCWPVLQGDITRMPARSLAGADLVAGGLPCTPHTRGGRQLGAADERHLWDAALTIIADARPRAVMLETSNAILSPRFTLERGATLRKLHALGYLTSWVVIYASEYGVPQYRRRAVLAAFSGPGEFRDFAWPERDLGPPATVGDALFPLAAADGWEGARAWAAGAQDAAPVVVGGSRKHGGADLGASQGKAAWRRLGIDPMGIADGPPGPDGKYPRGRGLTGDAGQTGLMLTVEMAARLQGFPPDWEFSGGKTSRYRQVGNAFPAPAAAAVGTAIRNALKDTG